VSDDILYVQVLVGKDFRLAAASVARAINRNTVLVVASSPCFPHGVIDDVAGIAQVSIVARNPSRPGTRRGQSSATQPIDL
jgi:hypothetical protein